MVAYFMDLDKEAWYYNAPPSGAARQRFCGPADYYSYGKHAIGSDVAVCRAGIRMAASVAS